MIGSLPLLAGAGCALSALTWWRPVWALCGLLASLPFFLQRTSTAPGAWLAALVFILEVTWLLRRRPDWAASWRAIAREPMLLLSVLFVAAAVASLSSLPLVSIWREYVAAIDGAVNLRWTDLPLAWASHGEGRREFPITAAALTFEAVGLMLIVWRETRDSSATARRLALALAAGTAMTAALGLLELVHVVDLEAWRGAYGSFQRPGSTQALAGNPGWLTQYVAYTLPYGLVLLEGRAPLSLRRALLIGYVALLVIALVLGYQRGGWITGVAVIVWVVVGARALTARAAHGLAGRTPLGTGLAFVGVVALVVLTVRQIPATSRADGALTLADYAARVASISAGDRLPYQRAGLMVWRLHPVLGGGHESFAYLYHRYFVSPGGPYQTPADVSSPYRVPDASSAHSLYLQTLAGTGAVGLLLLLALFAVAGWATWRAGRAPTTPDPYRTVRWAAAGSLLAVALYGFVQEVFYVHALRLLCFVTLGLIAGTTAGRLRLPAGAAPRLAGALGAAFILHLAYEYAWADPGRLLGDSPMGLYDEEHLVEVDTARWTADEAAWPVPAGATAITFDARSLAPFPQQLRVRACRALTRVTLADHNWRQIQVPLSGCATRDHVRLEVVPPWRPPGDGRLLGVMTRAVTLR